MKYKEQKIYPPPHEGPTIVRAHGSILVDAAGKEYVDLSSGAGMALLGYGNTEIKKLAVKQFDKLAVCPQKLPTNESTALARKLLSLFGPAYDRVAPAVTGSEAVEVAMKFASDITGNDKYISFGEAYHGHTMGAGNLGVAYSGQKRNKYFLKVAAPRSVKQARSILREIKRIFQKGGIAAFVAEGCISNAGYRKLPTVFVRSLARLCRDHGVILIFDEVLTGFGRTGKMFSFEYHGIKPDMVCLSKGLGSGFAAVAAVVLRKSIKTSHDYMSSYAWSPLSAAIAARNIDIIRRKKLVQRSALLGAYTLKRLRTHLSVSAVVDYVGGLGLGLSIKFREQNVLNEVYEHCLEDGVIFFKNPFMKILFIQPPLIISKKELTGAVDLVIKNIIDYDQKY